MRTCCQGIMLLMLLGLMGCSGPKTRELAPPPEQPKNSVASQTQAPESTLVVRGTIIGRGTSRGKTLAAWSGIPVGKGWIRIKPGAQPDLPPEWNDSLLVQLPQGSDLDSFSPQLAVLVRGTVRRPAPLSADEIQGRAQVPIHLGRSGLNRTVKRETVLVATEAQVQSP